MANNVLLFFRHGYQHDNEKIAQSGLIQPAKLKNSHLFLNTPCI